jgi:hypothetical protein
MLLGYQVTRYSFLKQNYPISNKLGLMYYGGFGYGIRGKRKIHGGFGFALSDPTGQTDIWGGFGGVMSGYRLIKRPVTLSLISWTGFGGVYTGRHTTNPGSGYFCISEELDLELGIPLLRWFMPVIFVGYQIAGNILPVPPVRGFLSYTPVVGIRITWGDFY